MGGGGDSSLVDDRPVLSSTFVGYGKKGKKVRKIKKKKFGKSGTSESMLNLS